MPAKRKGGFFAQTPRPEDEEARRREVEALLAPRRTMPQDIGIERIEPNPFQARRTFVDLEELAQAMQAQGFVSRLRVRPHPDRAGFFQLVYGERRLRAAALAAIDTVPCDVAEHSDEELIEIGLAENIQRRDLNPLEEAHAFQTFIDQRGYSIRRLAERLGKDKSYVEDRVILLRLPSDVQEMVAQRPDSLRAAREIAKLPDAAARKPIIDGVIGEQLTTQDVRVIVRQATTTAENQATHTATSAPTDGGGTRGPQQTQNAHDHLARTLERDQRTIAAILSRWQATMAQGDQERAQVSAALIQVLTQAQHLTDALDTEWQPQ